MVSKTIAEALAKVLRDIHRLKKVEKNDHGKYAYVSVDDVKDHVRPLLSDAGLHVSVTETAFDLIGVEGRNGITSSARITYAITLRHVSGQALPADIITIVLPYTGAQTAGAARSYAVKEWMKSTLLVSTGEKDFIQGGADADAYEQQDYTVSITGEQFRTLQGLIEKTGSDEAKLLAYVQAEALEDLTLAQFRKAETALRKKLTTPKPEAA